MATELQLGDFLFGENHSYLAKFKNGLFKVKIEKITPKGNIRLNNGKLLDSDLHVKGASAWGEDTYYKPTPELVARYELEQVQRNVEKQVEQLEVSLLTMEQLHQLSSLLKTLPKKSK